MKARARILGHPLHRVLIVFPLGLLATSFFFDLAWLVRGRDQLAIVAWWLILAGVGGGLVAALVGLVDWLAIPEGTRARRVVGGVALVLGRFVPIVRTFVSLAAGISSDPRRKFNLWNILGAVLWIGLIGTAGVLLGGIEFVHKNIELLAVIIVLVSVVPVAIEYIRGRKKEQKALSE